jgi:hypothetical protein
MILSFVYSVQPLVHLLLELSHLCSEELLHMFLELSHLCSEELLFLLPTPIHVCKVVAALLGR